MRGDLIVHVIPVALTLMKELIINGLYKGDFLEGFMAGNIIWRFIICRLGHWTDRAVTRRR